MDELAYIELMGPKNFLTWSKENPIWWISYRTTIAGGWSDDDRIEWEACGAKYIIFFDHTRDDEARLFALRVLERDSHFKAVKVSKFARDGEKIMVFIGKDDKRKKKLTHYAKEFDFIMWSVTGIDDKSPLEQHLNDKYAEYIKCLAMAFRGMEDDGGVRVNQTPF